MSSSHDLSALGAASAKDLQPLRSDGLGTLQRGLPSGAHAPDEGEKVAQVAHDFEALLVKQIFASMRHTLASDDKGFGEQMFTGMLDEQLASHIAEQGGMGLAEPLTQVLRGPVDEPIRRQEDDDVRRLSQR